MRALIFPGQGSQSVGMGKGLFERFPRYVEEADHVMGLSMRELCLTDPGRLLSSTRFAQPAIFLVNALHLAAWREETGAEAAWLAGHSLGEYSALLAAGVFDFKTGLQIVKKRGEVFTKASGSMAAVVGLTAQELRAFLASRRHTELDLANFNSLNQVVLAGPPAALAAVRPELESTCGAMFHPLQVSGAFHSRYMRGLKEEFEAFLASCRFNEPTLPVVSNVTARPYEPGIVCEYLVEQVDHPVRWRESLRYMLRQGVDDWVELGNGRILSSLVKAVLGESPGAGAASVC